MVSDVYMTKRPVVVTGVSSGIGAAIADRFRETAPVIGVDATALEDPNAAADRPYPLQCVTGDVGSDGTWAEVERALSDVGAPQCLVFNAGRPKLGTVLDLDLSDWIDTFTGNVFGVALGLRRLLPAMIDAGGGVVLAISSVNARFAEQGLIAYSASKAALTSLIRSVAVDHARDSIRANVIEPGTVDTPAFRRVMDTADDPAAFLAERAERNPMGRILTPAEIAEAAYFLCGEAASGMTESVLTIDAGLTASFDFRADTTGYRVSERQ